MEKISEKTFRYQKIEGVQVVYDKEKWHSITNGKKQLILPAYQDVQKQL